MKKVTVTGSNLENYLGVHKYLPDRLPCTDQVGLVTGLAWTSVGGETLEVEVNVMDGSGKLELTGNLGDVMKESSAIAQALVQSRFPEQAELFEKNDLHISSKDLADQIPHAVYCPTLEQVADALERLAQPGDMIITVGAGDIYRAGEMLLKRGDAQ